MRNCASTCDYSTCLDRALKKHVTVGLRSKKQLTLLSREYSLEESIQQAIADEAAVRESANVVPSFIATNSLNFVKRHSLSTKDIKTDKPRHTANFRVSVNLKSYAISKSPYTRYPVVIQDIRGMIAISAIVFAINVRKRDISIGCVFFLKMCKL